MIDFNDVRYFCLSLPHVTEDFPFDASTLAFRVGGKIFSLADVDEASSMNLKCDPEKAIDLRERHHFILPGYHMSKKHWNTIVFDPELSMDFLKELIVHSYELIFNSLTKKQKEELLKN